jgi:uncharacterized protein YbaR (Trm112 family)
MRSELLTLLRCPSCASSTGLEVEAIAGDEREIREALLRCRYCPLERRVLDGVPDLMLDPSPEVRAEIAGLERFARQMLADGWDRSRVLKLPEDGSGYWWAQGRSMERLLATVPFAPGQSILRAGPGPDVRTALCRQQL